MHHFEWCYISLASQNDSAHFLDSTVLSPKMNKNGLEKIASTCLSCHYAQFKGFCVLIHHAKTQARDIKGFFPIGW